jgi:nitrile hydratase accessory protein
MAMAGIPHGRMPVADGEPVFTEPWQGRAFVLAVETVERLRLDWDEFRTRLIAVIDADPHRPYYESWLMALERLIIDHHAADTGELDKQRMRAASYRVDEPGNGDLEIFPIAVDEVVLRRILDTLFVRWWPHIRFGPIIQRAVYELQAPRQPELTMLDGYLTIGFDGWHVHLCIGEHIGSPARPVAPEVARLRRCTYAELVRLFADGAPTSWMFRMHNGAGEQQLTVLLPNPFLDDDQYPLSEPDWSRLDCWNELRRDILGLPPDPVDRSATRFVHP